MAKAVFCFLFSREEIWVNPLSFNSTGLRPCILCQTHSHNVSKQHLEVYKESGHRQASPGQIPLSMILALSLGTNL